MKRAIACLLLTFVVVACLPSAQTSGLGLILIDDEIHMLVNRCAGQQIVGVEATTIEPAELEVLWEIEGLEESRIDEWVISEAPDGFAETTPLAVDLHSLEKFAVHVVFSDGSESGSSVWPEDLMEDSVRLDGGVHSREEFFALDYNYW